MRNERVESAVEIQYRRGVSSSMVPVQRPSQTKKLKMSKGVFRQRVMGMSAGSIFIILATQITIQMFQSSYGVEKLVHAYTLDDSPGMRQWIGTTTIRQSPLVKIALQEQIDLINETLYLQQSKSFSFQPCNNLNARLQEIYSDHWQRRLYFEAVMGTAYNYTFLSGIELIAPVVDCGSVIIRTNDSTQGKFYFLTRTIADPEDVRLITLSMAVQEFWIHSETQVGSAAVASLTLINNLKSEHVDHYFIASLGYPFYKFDFMACDLLGNGKRDILFQLRTIPRNPKTELTKVLTTSHRSGFYLTAESGRHNIRYQIWLLDNTPISAITTWRWKSKNTSRNVWPWVHVLDSMFALYVTGHIFQAILIIHQAFRDGVLWPADGSVTMTKPFLLRGAIVVLFWCLSSFWDLTEFCLRDAYEIAGVDRIFSFTELLRMDITNIAFTYTSYLAHLTKERVDFFLPLYLSSFSASI